MASKAPKHFLQAHRLICGRDKLLRKAHSKAEYKLLARASQPVRGWQYCRPRNIEKDNEEEGKRKSSPFAFYVRKKKNRLDAQKLIPPVISLGGKAIFTDVYEIGPLKAQANVQPSPIQSGFSVGNDKNINAGTVGAIVSTGGNARFILSNAHVLAPQGRRARPTSMRASRPRRQWRSTAPVGRLRHIADLQPDALNRADAALAEIKSRPRAQHLDRWRVGAAIRRRHGRGRHESGRPRPHHLVHQRRRERSSL